MPYSDPVNWQPISEMPLIAGMIDESIKDTRAFIKTLTEARYSKRPHVMDDATVDRIDRVHTEKPEFVGIYAQHRPLANGETVRGSSTRARPDGGTKPTWGHHGIFPKEHAKCRY